MNGQYEDFYKNVQAVLFITMVFEISILFIVAGLWCDAMYPIHYITSTEELSQITNVGAPIQPNGLLKIIGLIGVCITAILGISICNGVYKIDDGDGP